MLLPPADTSSAAAVFHPLYDHFRRKDQAGQRRLIAAMVACFLAEVWDGKKVFAVAGRDHVARHANGLRYALAGR